MKCADLHLHTVFSDSTYTPEELISESLKNGLSAVAVVDHDCTDGIEPAIKIGEDKGIEVLPGIELSAEDAGQEVHILGYLIDYKAKRLVEKLGFLRKNRVERIYKITDKLKELGLELKADSVFELARHGTVGRLHVARAMVKEKLVGSIAEAFRRYIGDKCPAYVCNFRFSPAEAINLIKEVRGIPVLAHPYTVSNDELIPALSGQGLMGLEVYYPEHSQSTVNFYLGLARKYNLLVTGGSDCHGSAKPGIKIGLVKIPYGLVENLKEAKQRMWGSPA